MLAHSSPQYLIHLADIARIVICLFSKSKECMRLLAMTNFVLTEFVDCVCWWRRKCAPKQKLTPPLAGLCRHDLFLLGLFDLFDLGVVKSDLGDVGNDLRLLGSGRETQGAAHKRGVLGGVMLAWLVVGLTLRGLVWLGLETNQWLRLGLELG